jgi:hypothetical protein
MHGVWGISDLDSNVKKHHDVSMRTTVTLDRDVERMVRDAMHRSRRSFKETMNAALRTGLAKPIRGRGRRFVIKARPMGLRAGIDPGSLNKVADALEVDAFLEKAEGTNHRRKRA